MSPATDWTEIIPPDEGARFERHAERLREMQRRHEAAAGKKLRALHAKANAGLEAELTVLPDLPEHARVGLFATPGTFRAYVRFSNGSGVPPFLTVARLVLPKQDTQSPRGRRVAELVEGFSFDPWHTLEDFRPLGNVMRARNPAYRLSTQERGAAPEPDGTEQLDG